MRVLLAAAFALAAAGACSSDDEPLTCETHEDCGVGSCLQAPQSSDRQCAVPDASCPGFQMRWHERSPSHAGECLVGDAPP